MNLKRSNTMKQRWKEGRYDHVAELNRQKNLYGRGNRPKVYPWKYNGKTVCYAENMGGVILTCKDIPEDYLWLDLSIN